MGGAMLKGWLGAESFARIHVVEPNPSPALRALARERTVTLSAVLQWKGETPSAVVLAIKPQVLKEADELLRELGRTGALVLSIAAGIRTKTLQALLGAGVRIVRAMPNTPGAIGRGITALHASENLRKSERRIVDALVAPLGDTVWLDDEKLMNAVTALSGSGPAYVFLLAEALAAAGCDNGLDAVTADRLARATIAGAGALLEADRRSSATLRQDVTSPGGTTEAALKILMGPNGLRPLIKNAVKAAARRSKELGR
jgi:pyrroline-5-carboxylate reductase